MDSIIYCCIPFVKGIIYLGFRRELDDCSSISTSFCYELYFNWLGGGGKMTLILSTSPVKHDKQ